MIRKLDQQILAPGFPLELSFIPEAGGHQRQIPAAFHTIP